VVDGQNFQRLGWVATSKRFEARATSHDVGIIYERVSFKQLSFQLPQNSGARGKGNRSLNGLAPILHWLSDQPVLRHD
jgi:hypothetical protein